MKTTFSYFILFALAVELGLVRAVCADSWSLEMKVEEDTEIIPPARLMGGVDSQGLTCVSLSDPDAPRYLDWNDRSKAGQVVFSPELPETGGYRVWAHVLWHCTCARAVGMTTSANSARSPDGKALALRGTTIQDDFRPRVWHWMDCGTFDFSAGRQEVRFLQYGHNVLIGGIALGLGPDFRPKGYIEHFGEYRLAQCPAELRETSNPGPIYLGDDLEWTNFRARVSFPIEAVQFTSEESALGLVFCRKPEGGAYELLVRRGTDGEMRAELHAVTNSASVLIAGSSHIPWGGSYHSLDIQRLGDEIRVQIDGLQVFQCTDDSFASGRIGIFRNDIKDFDFEEVHIVPRTDAVEYFTKDCAWKTVGGTWRSLTSEPGSGNEGSLYGIAPTGTAMFLSDWQVGSYYGATTQVKVGSGESSGIVFDFIDSNNYSTAGISIGEPSGASVCNFQLASIRNGVRTILASRSVDAMLDQWANIGIEKGPGKLAAVFEGQWLASYESDRWSDSGSIGVYVGRGSEAEFGAMHYEEDSMFEGQEYTFEPDLDMYSVSHWKALEGTIFLDRHPATLSLRQFPPGSSRIALALNRALETNTSIRVSFSPGIGSGASRTSDRVNLGFGELASGIQDVGVSESSRLGIRLKSHAPLPVEYEITVDEKMTKELIVLRNEEIVSRTSLLHEPQDSRFELRVDLSAGSLVAIANGRKSDEVALCAAAIANGKFELSIIGKHLIENDIVRVVSVFLDPLCQKIIPAE